MNNSYPFRLRRISFIIGRGYCFLFTTLLSWQRLLIQWTRPYLLGIMNEGEAHSLHPWGTNTPIWTRCWSSVLKVSRWMWGTGYALECTGTASGSISMWNVLCGYTPSVPSNNFLCLLRRTFRSSFWSSFRWSMLLTASLMSVGLYLASKIYVA